MRWIAVILLSLSFGITLQNTWVSVDFLSNQDYIVEELCENKDKPEMNCEGRCYLKKRMTLLLDKVKGLSPEETSPTNMAFMFYFVEDINSTDAKADPEVSCGACRTVDQLHDAHIELATPPPRFM